MFQILWAEPICSMGMFVCFSLSIAGLVLLAAKYVGYIKEAENMSIAKRKELRAIKTKFLNSYVRQDVTEEEKYTLSEHVNVEVFVDKAINKIKIGGLRPYLWRFLCGQSLIAGIVFAGAGIMRSILAGKSFGEISVFYLLSFVEIYVYFSVVSICNFEGKDRQLRLTIVEYLENHMVNRIRVAQAFQAEEKVIEKLKEEQKQKEAFSKEREQELELLLKEFIST